jgi:hypothetical protein
MQKTAIDPRAAGLPVAGGSESLFSDSMFRRSRAARRRLAPELAAARVLCNQLRRKRVSAEKKRIVHLICMNLLAVLKRRA